MLQTIETMTRTREYYHIKPQNEIFDERKKLKTTSILPKEKRLIYIYIYIYIYKNLDIHVKMTI